MDYKKTDAEATTITRNITDFEEKTNSIYEAIVVMSKRANQIGAEVKTELDNKLSEFASTTDNLEEIFENREQIEISKFYERLPKATLIALQEFLDDKIYYRSPADEQDNNREKE
ncbi:MAG: DNA-directed RNA polymerase subunit omega [Flavobacteriales bacterium]|nr:DNA-directed RNA polymerase subunit omega [Flavobacteriales bacterium]